MLNRVDKKANRKARHLRVRKKLPELSKDLDLLYINQIVTFIAN